MKRIEMISFLLEMSTQVLFSTWIGWSSRIRFCCMDPAKGKVAEDEETEPLITLGKLHDAEQGQSSQQPQFETYLCVSP